MQGEVAKQHEAMMKDLPRGCRKLPDGGSALENVVNLYKYYFTFQQDECVTYYEHLYIDPIVKGSPMEVRLVVKAPLHGVYASLSNKSHDSLERTKPEVKL